MNEYKSNKMKKVLLELIKEVDEKGESITGKTLKNLPEYFMSVNIAESLSKHFKTMKFSMEDKVLKLCGDLDIEVNDNHKYFETCRLNGSVDMVVRSEINNKIMHLIEFKKSTGIAFVKDVRRLAWFCLKSGSDRKITRHYIVAVTYRSKDSKKNNVKDLEKLIEQDLEKNFPAKFVKNDINISIENEPLGHSNQYALILEIKSKIQKI